MSTDPHFTPEEKAEVLEKAIEYIKEPASWTTGKWKCDLYLADKKGNYITDADGQAIQKCDPLNRPMHQYCVEGAVNQATYDVVGEKRAIELGAYDPNGSDDNDEFGGIQNESDYGVFPTDLLGIDELVRARYPDSEYAEETHAAMALNDNMGAEDPEKAHKAILSVLGERLTEIKGKLGR